MSTEYFLDREDQLRLLDLLREIPELVEEVAITISRQDRLGSGGGAQINPNSYRERPVFFNEKAADVANDLRVVLVSWVGYVLEHRGLEWEGDDSTLRLARWLDKNIVSLALTPGSDEALDEIDDAVWSIRRAVDRGPDRLPTVVSPEREAEARERAKVLWVKPGQVEGLMKSLGHPPLKAATVRKWAERGKIEKREDGLYSLGELLKLNPRREVVTN
jgi:hypothetical protein